MTLLNNFQPGSNCTLPCLAVLMGLTVAQQAAGCVHGFPPDGDGFYSRGDVVSLVRVDTQGPGGQVSELATMAGSAIVCYKGCDSGDRIKISIVGCEPRFPNAAGQVVLIFGQRVENLLVADEDAVWNGAAIEGLSATRDSADPVDLASIKRGLSDQLDSGEGKAQENALNWLAAFGHLPQSTREVLRRIAADEDATLILRMSALAALMREPTLDGLKIAASLAARYGPRISEAGTSKLIVGQEIAVMRDDKGFDSFAAIAEAPEPLGNWRWSALSGLRRLRTARAVPIFIRALDIEDRSCQHLAVLGLAEITGKSGSEFGPGAPLFNANPRYYLDNWRRWWKEEGEIRYAVAVPVKEQK